MSCRSPRTSSSPSRNRTVLVVNPHRATARKRAVTSSRAMAEYLRDSAASRQPTMIWGYQWNTWPKIFQLVSYLLRLFLHIDLCRAGHFSWSQFQSICTSGKINAIESTKLMHLFMVFLARLSFTMASGKLPRVGVFLYKGMCACLAGLSWFLNASAAQRFRPRWARVSRRSWQLRGN